MVGLICSHMLLELFVEPISQITANASSTVTIEYGRESSLVG